MVLNLGSLKEQSVLLTTEPSSFLVYKEHLQISKNKAEQHNDKWIKKINSKKLHQVIVAHTFNPSTWEAEAGKYLSLRPAWSTG